MSQTPHVLGALRLPELLRKVCRHAGLAPPPAPATNERFAVRCGSEPPGLLAALLEEALVEDGAEVTVWPPGDAPDASATRPGHVTVRPGFDGACPADHELRQAAQPAGGRVLMFAVERRDDSGRLLGVTWAALPEGEPGPRDGFRAAVLRWDGAGPAKKNRP